MSVDIDIRSINSAINVLRSVLDFDSCNDNVEGDGSESKATSIASIFAFAANKIGRRVNRMPTATRFASMYCTVIVDAKCP